MHCISLNATTINAPHNPEIIRCKWCDTSRNRLNSKKKNIKFLSIGKQQQHKHFKTIARQHRPPEEAVFAPAGWPRVLDNPVLFAWCIFNAVTNLCNESHDLNKEHCYYALAGLGLGALWRSRGAHGSTDFENCRSLWCRIYWIVNQKWFIMHVSQNCHAFSQLLG